MKELKKILYESVFDMDDTELDYAKSDLWDIFNSNTEEEFNRRVEFLETRLRNSAELAPWDDKGFLVRKTGRRYIRISRWSGEIKGIRKFFFGTDKGPYEMFWSARHRVECRKAKHIDILEYPIWPKWKADDYDEYPLYILPKNLNDSYIKLTRWVR